MPQSVQVEDLVQQGAIGLIEAARNYDPESGNKFWTFAYRRVAGAMTDHLRGLDPVGRRLRTRAKQYHQASHRLTQELGRLPTFSELLADLDWKHHDLVEVLRCPSTHSMDDEISVKHQQLDSKRLLWQDLVAGRVEDPSNQAQFEGAFRELVKGLTVDDQTAIWLWCVRGSSMKKIAAALGVSESRVSQRISQAMKQLRKAWERSFG